VTATVRLALAASATRRVRRRASFDRVAGRVLTGTVWDMADPAPTWDQWREAAERIDVGGLGVAVYDLGISTGRVVTYLHGYPSSSLDVAPVMAHLHGVRVVAVDLPGFGASDKPRDHPYSIDGAARAVEAAWATLGIGATVVAAHDYSVSVAQELLARGDERITAVAFMNGGLYPDLHRPTAGQQALLDPEHGATFAAAVTEETFIRGIEGTWGQRVPLDLHAATQMHRSMAESGGVSMMHTLLHYIADRRANADRWATAIDEAQVPLAFVWGDLDPVSGAHMIERVEERRPDARIVRMADVAHWPPLEAPDAVAAELLRLLDRA
jgi:pimeloyl-ACP methyl ester carboxylesterase